MISTLVVSTGNTIHAEIKAQRNACSFLTSHIASLELWLCTIKATSLRSAGAPVCSELSLCVILHRKMERQEMAGCCDTYKAEYSYIGFCSCFRASGLLCADTAACTLVAEEPERAKRKAKVKMIKKQKKQKRSAIIQSTVICRNLKVMCPFHSQTHQTVI